jgi:hypothetical protein
MQTATAPLKPVHRWWSGIPILRAFFQKSDEVAVREPGKRLLSAPRPIAPYAAEHWEFAWLSVIAYNQTPAGARRAVKEARAPVPGDAVARRDPRQPLTEAGWTQWDNFPDDGLQRKIAATHLRVEVWENKERRSVAVTFGGTVFNNENDWRANLRWILPLGRDQYTDVVQTFAPEFAKEFRRRLADPSGTHLADTRLFATGHSLGGGLAQQFAYSLPLDPKVKRVCAVYAFDPSPVTGFYSVARHLRTENKQNLWIDRIYERGEILALVRSLTSLLHKPSARHATIRGIRYFLFASWNPIADHSIVRFASRLDTFRPQRATARSDF